MVGEEFVESGGAQGQGLDALLRDIGRHMRHGDDPGDRAVDLQRHVRRHIGGAKKSEPGRELEAGQAIFTDSRHIRKQGYAAFGDDRQQTQGRRIHEGLRPKRGDDEQIRIAAHEAVQRFRRALERHMHDVDGRAIGEIGHGQMGGAANASRSIVQATGIRLGVGDEFSDRLRGQASVDEQDIGAIAHMGDGGEILHGIEGRLAVERGADGVAGGRHQKRGSIGL